MNAGLRALCKLASACRGDLPPILLIGAETFIGRHFLYWWTQMRGEAWVASPGASIRGSLREVSFANRISLDDALIERCIRPLARDAGERRLRSLNIAECWYFAGLCSDKPDEARRAVLLCAEAGTRRFLHVSPLAAEADPRALDVEQAVEQACAELGIEAVIFRLPFVVGSDLGAAPGGFGITGFFQAAAAEDFCELRRERINIVRIERAIQDLLCVRERALAPGMRVNLGGPADLDLADCANAVRSAARDLPVEHGSADLNEWIRRHAPCLGGFERSSILPMQPAYSLGDLRRDSSEWLLWSRLRQSNGEAHLLNYHEAGREIAYITAGPSDAPPLFLINAYDNPAEIFVPLIAELRDYRIISWETGGLRSPGDLTGTEILDGCAQTRIFQALLRKTSALDPFVVGWCSGTQIALELLRTMPREIRAAVLLNNGLPADPRPESYTSYIRQLQRTCTVIRQSPDLAHLFCEMFFPGAADDIEESGSAPFAALPSFLRHLISNPFRTPDDLYRYALVSLQYWDEARKNRSLAVEDTPVLIYSAARDAVAHPRASLEIHNLLPQSILHLDESGTHFEHFLTPSKIAQLISDFFHQEGTLCCVAAVTQTGGA